MTKKNNNKMNMYLLKACVHQLNRELPYTRKSSEIYAVMEVIKEIIESLENKG